MISGVILAAGSSQRMGKPKALLTIGGETFLRRIERVLASARVNDIVLVLGSHAEQIRNTLGWFHGTIVINENWEQGQLTSLIAGMKAVDRETNQGMIVCPVDHPMMSQSVIVDLLQGFWKSRKNIIVPVCDGRRGHPVIWGRTLFDAIRTASVHEGARSLLRTFPDEISEIQVTERGILYNIDTPGDYKLLMAEYKL